VALAIVASLIGTPVQPQPVQVNVTGLTVGELFTVTASCDGWSDVVQGADDVVAESTQAILVDIATPLNVELTYTVVQGASSATSSPVTVECPAESILQSLDGTVIAEFFWDDNTDPRAQEVRAAFYRPAGADRAVMHYDIAGADSGTIVAETDGADTQALQRLIHDGAPVLVRTTPGLRDLDPVEVLGISAASRHLVGTGTLRRWELAYTLTTADDDAPLAMVTFEHLNTVLAGMTIADWNTMFAGQTLANVNAYDWIGEAS
jgi:hypothetical protein